MAGLKLDVRRDVKKLTRHLSKLEKRIVPRVTARAINEVAVNARSQAIKEVARSKNLPQKNIRNRFDKYGRKKGERTRLKKAKASYQVATLSVYMRGIPAIQLVTRSQQVRSILKRPRGGVRAYGGRRYERAFVEQASAGNAQLFVRRGRGRTPLGVVKVGVRRALTKTYDDKVGNSGKEFRRRFNRILSHQLAR